MFPAGCGGRPSVWERLAIPAWQAGESHPEQFSAPNAKGSRLCDASPRGALAVELFYALSPVLAVYECYAILQSSLHVLPL